MTCRKFCTIAGRRIQDLRYSFNDGENGEIKVELFPDSEGSNTLVISNTGKGLPPDFDLDKSANLGLKLVKAFVIDIKGSIEIGKNSGTTFTIKF